MHRKNLSLYFALLRLNDLAGLKVSVGLVTRMSYRQTRFESLLQFVEACKKTSRRVIAQNKGLIQISTPEPIDDSARGWAFIDVATDCARHQFLDEKVSASIHECVQVRLQWVHVGTKNFFRPSDTIVDIY